MPLDLKKLETEIRTMGLIFGMDLSELKIEESKVKRGLRKLVLPWSVTKEFLEDNGDGDEAEAMIQNSMLMQIATDLTDLVIEGDETSRDRLLISMDGLKKKKLDPAHAILKVHVGEVKRVYTFETQEYNYTWTFYVGLEENIDWTEFDAKVIYTTYDID